MTILVIDHKLCYLYTLRTFLCSSLHIFCITAR